MQDASGMKSQGGEPGKVLIVVSQHLNALCLWVSSHQETSAQERWSRGVGCFPPSVAQNVWRMRGVFQLKSGSLRDSVAFVWFSPDGQVWMVCICLGQSLRSLPECRNLGC